MSRSRIAALAFVASIVIAGSAFAQPVPVSVAGDWDVTVQSPQGTNTVLVTLKQDGEKLDGLFKSPLGELPFTGTLTGNEMKFTFSFPVDGQPLLITMTGKVDGDAIAGKADFGGFAEGDWSANAREAGRRGGRGNSHARDDHRRNSHVDLDDHRLLRDHCGRWLRRQMGRGREDARRRLPGHRQPHRRGRETLRHVREPDG